MFGSLIGCSPARGGCTPKADFVAGTGELFPRARGMHRYPMREHARSRTLPAEAGIDRALTVVGSSESLNVWAELGQSTLQTD